MEIKGCYETIADFLFYGWSKIAGTVPWCIGGLFIVAISLIIYLIIGNDQSSKHQVGENEKNKNIIF